MTKVIAVEVCQHHMEMKKKKKMSQTQSATECVLKVKEERKEVMMEIKEKSVISAHQSLNM